MIGFACNSRIPLAKCLKGRPITFCNSTKSYLSPFSKLPKGNRAPHANSVKLRRNCMRYSVDFRQFAKRAQITFGAIAKGNLLPFAMCLKSKQTFWNNFTKVISGLLCSFWTTDTELTFKTFKYTKSSTACKFACGICELHATPITFCNTAGRTKI